MKRTSWILCAVVALAASTTQAAPVFKITEVWSGLSGPDGTADWIEVTNLGDMDGDTATLFYDDVSADIGDAGQLDSFILSPGQSAIFLEDDAPSNDVDFTTSIEEFRAIWGPVARVGLTNGGGGLGQGGDAAFILDSLGNEIDSLVYSASGDTATFDDPTGMGAQTLSALGVNGAYESSPFVNADIALPPGDTVTLIGSPGRIPEPTALVLAALGFAALAARPRG